MRPGLVACATLCGVLAGTAAAPPPTRILFIGNSLTVANDLPKMLTTMASAAGIPLTYRVVAYPDYSLEDHWTRGDAAQAIASERWSFVVLQQGPSALPESRVLLRDYTKRFAALASRAGARTALFMVWPSMDRNLDFDSVHESYRLAAADVHGVFVPAGDAWREVWRQRPGAALYGPDGFHPTPFGSYVAAAAMFAALLDRSAVGLLAPGLTPADAAAAQRAAESLRRASREPSLAAYIACASCSSIHDVPNRSRSIANRFANGVCSSFMKTSPPSVSTR